MKFNVKTFLLISLLSVSLVIRIYKLEYPGILSSKWGDGTRDYLVAHYIKQYGERPLLGPFNLFFDSGIKNNPLYYYLLAIFLIAKDSVETLGIINILFQIATIALIYLITKVIFNEKSAILSSLLFAFTPHILQQSEYMWQPYLMQPVALLSLYLLILAYFKKSLKLLFVSLIVIALAFALNYPAFPWVIPILSLSFLILKIWGAKLKLYLGGFLTFSLTLITLYIPVFIYYLQNGVKFNGQIPFFKSLPNFLNNLIYNFSQVFDTFFLNWWLVSLLTFMMIIYLFLEKTKQRWFFLIGLILFLSPIFLSSLFNKNQLHYLILSFPIFTILVSAICRIFKNSLIWLIIALILFKIFSQDFIFEQNSAFESGDEKNFVRKEDSAAFKPQRFIFLNLKKNDVSGALIKSAASSVHQEVLNIKLIENLSDFNFFQIISFANRGSNFRYPTLDTVLLVPLEKSLSIKLAKISDNDPYNLVQINDENYIFLACFEFDDSSRVYDCSNSFLTFYPKHKVLKNIYNKHPISIYLTKRL